MVNSFRWDLHCAAIIQHLLYGMEKMHCHQATVKEPLKDSQGFSPLLRLWPWHKLVGGGRTTCIRLGHRGYKTSGPARKWNISAWNKSQGAGEVCSLAKFGLHTLVNVGHNFSGNPKVSNEALYPGSMQHHSGSECCSEHWSPARWEWDSPQTETEDAPHPSALH